jgi:PAS domain S-box-containing protein
LTEREARLSTILNSSNYTIISTNQDGIIQTFNATAERLLGYKAEEVIGKATPQIVHDSEEIMRRAQELSKELGYTIKPGFDVFVAKIRGGAPMNIVDVHQKDGTRFPVCSRPQ